MSSDTFNCFVDDWFDDVVAGEAVDEELGVCPVTDIAAPRWLGEDVQERRIEEQPQQPKRECLRLMTFRSLQVVLLSVVVILVVSALFVVVALLPLLDSTLLHAASVPAGPPFSEPFSASTFPHTDFLWSYE